MDHSLALTPDQAVETIRNMNLITKETFDGFLVALLAWYQEESYRTKTIPNLFDVFNFQDDFSQMFFELFVESLAWRHTYIDREDEEKKSEFTKEERSYYNQLFKDNFMKLQEPMIEDMERILQSMNLVYQWDSFAAGGTDLIVKNQVVCEVW